MNITIENKKENILLDCVDVKGTATFEGATCSNSQLAEALAKELKSEPALIVARSIHTIFGNHKASFSAAVYKNAQARQKYETTPSHLKKKEKSEPAKQAKK